MDGKNKAFRGSESSKGQVFLIIGIVIALSLILIYVKTNFDVALKKKEFYVGEEKDIIFTNIQNEFRESFDIGVKKDDLNQTLRNFTVFMDERLKNRELDVLYSFSIYDNSSLDVSVWNFLERGMEDVNISQNLTGGSYSCGDLSSGENCYNSWSSPGETGVYHVNVTYAGSGSETYEGWTGPKGKYSALFYRLEFETGETQLTDEDTAKAKPLVP